MNNYLASIAARTQNLNPPVRPRLGNRFEPASELRERSIDSRELNRLTRAEDSHPGSETERDGAVEANRRRRSEGQPSESLNAPHHPPPATTSPRKEDSTSRPLSGYSITLSPASTVRTQSEQTLNQPQPEPRYARSAAKPGEPRIEAAEPGKTESSTSAKPLEGNWPESRSNDQSPNVTRRQRAAEEERVPTGSTPSSKTIQPSLSRLQEEGLVKSPVAGTKSAIERDASTVVSQEQKFARIAPIVDLGAERLSLHRRGAQSQPTVHVTIGRIEVRAVQTSPQSPAKLLTTTQVMNLNEYMRRRNQGGAR